jgi:hypothetical protein
MNACIFKSASIPALIAAVVLVAGCNKENAPAAAGTTSNAPAATATPSNAPSATAPSNAPSAGAPSGVHPSAGIVSAEKNSFDQVTSKLDKGGNFYLYLSTEQVLGNLSKGIGTLSNVISQTPLAPEIGSQNLARIFEVVDNLVKDSGVEHISGVGASSIARAPGFYLNKLVVHHYEGQGDGMIWNVFGKAPHPLKELDLLPENTALAAYADLDIPLAWKTIESELKKLHIPEVDQALATMPDEFKDGTGMDLDDALGSLGGGYGFIFTLDESNQIKLPIGDDLQIPDPGLAIFFKVKNDAIYNRVVEVTKDVDEVTSANQDGNKSISYSLPSALKKSVPVSLKPTLARVGDYLILTSTDKLLQDIVAVQSGKKSGFKATAEFKKLSQDIPVAGNNFTLLSEKFGKTLTKALQGVVSSTQAGVQSQFLQDMMASNAVACSFSVGVNGPDGWESCGNGTKSIGPTAMLLPAAATVGMLAAIAIPNFVRARGTAQNNACINNLRMIDGAKGQWALEKHKQNSDTPTWDDLRPYLEFGPNKNMPVCPEGGTYIIGRIDEKPRCTIPGHVLP